MLHPNLVQNISDKEAETFNVHNSLCFLLKRSRQHLYLRKRSSQLRIKFSPDLHERHESEHFNDGIKYTRTQSRFSVNP